MTRGVHGGAGAAGRLVLVAGLLAAILTSRGSAAEPDLRLARLTPESDAAVTAPAPDQPLSRADVARYQQIFTLQRAGDWAEADRLIAALDDRLLVGHVLAERYLHPTAYRSRYGELQAWLDRYADLPQAGRIFQIAATRRPPGAKRVSKPLTVRLEEAERAKARTPGSGGPAGQWRKGLAAWRAGQPGEAAQRFVKAMAGEDQAAAASFWAARSYLRAGKPQLVARLLRQAAGGDDEFYGLLAQRMLEDRVDFDWQEERLDARALELLLRYAAGQRAMALAQLGELELADDELQLLAARARPELAEALVALAMRLELPSVQMRAAHQLSRLDGRRHDKARYPLPRWQPAGGYRLDPTLVHAIIRAESGFDPWARSPKGAIGLMQVMPDTARLVAKSLKIAYRGERWLMHPPTNMKIGQVWLRRLAASKRIDNSLIHLIAAYNAGEGRVADWANGELRHAGDDPLLYIESIPLGETRTYIKRVLASLWAYQARQGREIASLRALAENRWPEVELGTEAVAKAGGSPRYARAN